MLPDVFTEHLAHGAPPLDSREAEAPMTVDPTGVAGPAPGSRGTEHLTDLPIKKNPSGFENEPCGGVFNAGVLSSDRPPGKNCKEKLLFLIYATFLAFD